MENRGERRFQVRNIIKINEIPIDTSSGNRGSIQLYGDWMNIVLYCIFNKKKTAYENMKI